MGSTLGEEFGKDATRGSDRLLEAGDPPPLRVLNSEGRSSFLLVADHAGACLPRRLGDMGLPPEDRTRHIAVDLGIAELTEAMARRLDATAVLQTYSRLVIDCNRSPERADAIPEVSDGSVIPANQALGAAERRARVDRIHAPYHAAIAGELARKDAVRCGGAIVALHSFTPRLSVADGEAPPRPWQAGVLYGGGDERYARAVLAELRQRLDAPIGDNEPYAMDGIDYTIPHHCFASRRPYVELEIRQDLLTAPGGAERWAEVLSAALTSALNSEQGLPDRA